MRGIEVVTSPSKARVLVDPMRREIVRLLASREMTEKELAEDLGLSDPAVGHHLKILRESGLIRITRRKAEKHGIVQKFYKANALLYLIDTRDMPLEIERYFMPRSLERVRGIVAGINALTDRPQSLSTVEMERFADTMASAIVHVARRHSTRRSLDREELVAMVYRDSLAYLMRKPKLLPDKVRSILLGAHRRMRMTR